jgi:hypothetical protein
MVGVDVDAETHAEAMAKAIIKVRDGVGEDTDAPHPKPFWVTGIAEDRYGDVLCFRQVGEE